MEAGSLAPEAMFLTNIPYPLSQAFFLFLQIYLFMTVLGVGCSGLSLVGESGDYSLVAVAGFSLQWLLLLWSTGSRVHGL